MLVARARLVALAALAAGAVALLLVLRGSDGGDQRFSAVVPAAHNLLVGQRINAGGKNVGEVTDIDPVDGGRRARIGMRITDDRYWPLPRDSRIELRFGGTVSYSNRYLLLTRGERRHQPLPEGGELPRGNVKVPVEIDEMLTAFDPRTRRDLRRMVGESSEVLDRSAADLNRTLGRSGPLTEEVAGLFEDLSANQEALGTLVRSTGRVVDAVDRSNPGVGPLIEGAGATFDAIAAEADDLQASLASFPQALRQTRTTLGRADVTLREAGALTRRLSPGVDELHRTADPLNDALASLRTATPLVRAVVRRTQSLGDTGQLFFRLRDNAPRLTSLFDQAATEVGCVRPWAPEIMLLASTWGDWLSPIDQRDHYLRATVQNFLPANYNSIPLTPGEARQIFPDMEYGFPRPPGALAGQPWFQPQCGVTEDSIDPSKDQEAQNFGTGNDELPPDMRPRARGGR